jgi:shikimate kinase
MQVFKRNGGRIFFLEVGPETAFRRIQADASSRTRRPALTDQDPMTEVKEQIEFRRPYYVNGADVVVAADGKSVEDLVKEILRDLGIDEEPPPGDRHEPDPATI